MVARELRLEELEGMIRHLDEVLTMSARLCAATGDLAWEQRYRAHVDTLEEAIKEAAALIPQVAAKEFMARTDVANQKLVAMEMHAFALVRAQQRERALLLLTGTEYAAQKEIYAAGLTTLIEAMEQQRQEGQGQRKLYAVVGSGLTAMAALLLVLGWMRALRSLSQYRAARAVAECGLRASEERFRDLAEKTEDGFWFYQCEPPQMLYVNPAVERIWGIPAAEFYRRPQSWLEAVHAEDRERVRNAHEACLRSKGATAYGAEFRVVRPDGTVRWLHDRGVIRLDEQGNPARMSGIAEDITERKQADAEIAALNTHLRHHAAELEVALAESEEFAYAAAHNLRTPLRGVDGFCQAVLEDDGDRLSPEGRRYLGRAREAAQRMADLIDELLQLSRLGHQSMLRRVTDLSALARTIADGLRQRDPQRPAEFVIASGLAAECDGSLVRRVLVELLENAWKFTAPRSPARIEFGAARQPDGTLAYFVRDNGVGFDMAHAGKLFVPFQRLHGPDEFPGTGMGLTTVQRIIRRHGGRVWAEGAVGRGATFYFTL